MRIPDVAFLHIRDVDTRIGSNYDKCSTAFAVVVR